jgi:hypothetical protein
LGFVELAYNVLHSRLENSKVNISARIAKPIIVNQESKNCRAAGLFYRGIFGLLESINYFSSSAVSTMALFFCQNLPFMCVEFVI